MQLDPNVARISAAVTAVAFASSTDATSSMTCGINACISIFEIGVAVVLQTYLRDAFVIGAL